MKATEQHFPMVLFIMLYKVDLIFSVVDRWNPKETTQMKAVKKHSCGTIYYAVQGGSTFGVCGRNPKVWLLKWKLRAIL